MKPKQEVVTTLAREEWDFDACPTEELSTCWQYERQRETGESRKAVLDFRKKFGLHTFEDLRGELQSRMGWVCAYECFPEWPRTPFLAIDSKERKRRLKLLPKVAGVDDWPYYLVTDITKILQNYAEGGFSSMLSGDTLRQSDWPEWREIVALDVNWLLTDEQMLRCFKAFLKQRRPPDVKQNESRGAGNDQRQSRADLKALGALRVLRHTQNDWMKAEEITERMSRKGKPLFENQPSWIRARKRAQTMLKEGAMAWHTRRLD